MHWKKIAREMGSSYPCAAMIRRLTLCAFLYATIPLAAASGISYTVDFDGVPDGKTLRALKMASALTALKKRPPASINALRYRADSDIPELLKVLHAQGYYEARVNIQIQEMFGHIHVLVAIDPGKRYKLEDFAIHLYCQSPAQPGACCTIDLEEIGIYLNKPAVAETILDGELKALQRLAQCGYPLATVEEREILADGKTKTLRVQLDIKTGERANFGPTTVNGLNKVRPRYIEQKMEWYEKEIYDSRLVEETQTRLIDSGLFSSVFISHEDQIAPNGEIAMRIDVEETKHQSVNIGVSYQTVFGPGITFGWANRNIGGMGRSLSFQGDATRIKQTGVATYLHPDFGRINQDMLVVGEAAHQAIYAYSMRSYNIMNRFERRCGKHFRWSIAAMGERLYVTESVHNGNYWLLEAPLFLRWSSANSLLNPTKGFTVEYTATPAFNTSDTSELYLTQQVSESSYLPLGKKEHVVLAQMLTFGTIWSNGLNAVPVSKRFLGGSEEDLRGYRYRTVSPLHHHKPIGGRSAIYASFEMRLRVSETIGLVPFFDIGSVYLTQLPTAHEKWYKSAGLGFRYFSFMGPFRIDLAFPLDRRKGIDRSYKVLASIGQTF
ncbi:MAG: BamA/TamA family outer membrane protein [Verrucomicrobia bacterium]|nr:BamA/TamA family outer membrane protein [Verrucomicrobiota bacterium]